MSEQWDRQVDIAATLKTWRTTRTSYRSQKAFTEATGYSSSTLGQWETGNILAAGSLRGLIAAYKNLGVIKRHEAEELWDKVRIYKQKENRATIFPKLDWDNIEGPSDGDSEAPFSEGMETKTFRIGGLEKPIALVAEGHYISARDQASARIRCRYSNVPVPLPDDLALLRRDFEADIARRKGAGEMGLPYNGSGYKLTGFDVSQRDFSDGEEIPLIDLQFAQTDYFTQCVTDLNVDNPIRNRYAKDIDLTAQPVPEFASCLGINLTLVTTDNYVLVVKRDNRTGIFPGTYHTSVAENLLRPADAGNDGAPDPFKCASRAAWEEIGLSVPPETVEFTHFTAWLPTCQHSLIGWSRLSMTQSKVEEQYRADVPKDKWEGRIIYIPFNPKAIAEFVVPNWERWAGVGLAALILALKQRFSIGEIADEIVRARE